MRKGYKVESVINNNFVLTIIDKKETILTGKGIGFRKKVGDIIDASQISGKFIMEDPQEKEKITMLTRDLPAEILDMAVLVSNKIEKETHKKVPAFSFMALADHMEFALERYRNNQVLPNLMMNEIIRFYPEEMELSMSIVESLNQTFQVSFNRDEAGFIALHLINILSEVKTDGLSQLKIVGDIVKMIENYLEVNIDEDSFYYQRLITHLKYFVFRALHHQKESRKDDFFYRISKVQYPKLHQCVDLIEEYLKFNYNIAMGNEEKGYLIVHLSGLMKRIREN